MNETTGFFAQRQSVLNEFNSILENLNPIDDFQTKRNKHIWAIIRSMEVDPKSWDTHCKINIEWIGSSLITELQTIKTNKDKEHLDLIFSMCFRFLLEHFLSTKNNLNIDLRTAQKFALSELNSFERIAKEQIEFATLELPISIFKQIANSESIQEIRNFNEISKHAKELQLKQEEDLLAREQRVSVLKEKLSSYESGFNFVGLYDGFNQLSKNKETENKNLIFWLRIFGCLIVTPLIFEISIILLNPKEITSNLAISIIPTISIVAIFIYYFRVILSEYKSTKAQQLQIELRKTLCQFIHNYAEYSSTLKDKDKSSMEKFENIIFSGITSNVENIPSAYDGLDQIGKILKSIKNPS